MWYTVGNITMRATAELYVAARGKGPLMEKTAVYYFTRSGTCEKLANELAARKEGQAYPITDGKNWKGPLGFIKGGYYATSKKALPAEYRPPEADENIILVAPVWAGTFPPAARCFIDALGRARIAVVASSGSGRLGDSEGFRSVTNVAGSAPLPEDI